MNNIDYLGTRLPSIWAAHIDLHIGSTLFFCLFFVFYVRSNDCAVAYVCVSKRLLYWQVKEFIARGLGPNFRRPSMTQRKGVSGLCSEEKHVTSFHFRKTKQMTCGVVLACSM